MHPRFLGDSYDVVKQSLLRWLSALGPWSVHPMYAEPPTQGDVEAFEYLLGVVAVSRAVLSPDTDRRVYFEPARNCDAHLFIDPDTGLAMRKKPRSELSSYLFVDELVEIALARSNLLTLVFDQSVARGGERRQLDAKLSELAERGLHGLAYVSHACFLLVARDVGLMERASKLVRRESRLPGTRFIERGPSA